MPFAGGACFRGAGPGKGAKASARRSDSHRQTTGGRRRGTLRGETVCSACSPAVGGRQYRVGGDVRARLLGELEASVDQTASDPPPTSEPESTKVRARRRRGGTPRGCRLAPSLR